MVAGLEAAMGLRGSRNQGFCWCHIGAIFAFLFSTAMSTPISRNLDSHILRSVVEHVFMPPKLPQEDPDDPIKQRTNVALCDNLLEAARRFLSDVPSSQRSLWEHMIKMMELARRVADAPLDEADLQDVLSNMAIGGMPLYLTLRSAFNKTFFSIRCFFYAYSRAECCSHCAQAFLR